MTILTVTGSCGVEKFAKTCQHGYNESYEQNYGDIMYESNH